MAGVGGVVEGKWRQLFLNSNKKKSYQTLTQSVLHLEKPKGVYTFYIFSSCE